MPGKFKNINSILELIMEKLPIYNLGRFSFVWYTINESIKNDEKRR